MDKVAWGVLSVESYAPVSLHLYQADAVDVGLGE